MILKSATSTTLSRTAITGSTVKPKVESTYFTWDFEKKLGRGYEIHFIDVSIHDGIIRFEVPSSIIIVDKEDGNHTFTFTNTYEELELVSTSIETQFFVVYECFQHGQSHGYKVIFQFRMSWINGFCRRF